MSDWPQTSQQKEAVVLPLIAAGKTATEICLMLGAPSRNAVVGVVHRARQAGRYPKSANPSPRAAPSKPKPKQRPQGPLAYNIAVKRENRALAKPAPPPKPVIVITRAAAWDPLPGVEPRPFAELGSMQCRWAVDGLDGPSRLFCGAETEMNCSWCPSHLRLAYAPRRQPDEGTKLQERE